MYFALVNANSFFDSAKKIKCILYLALCSVKFDECAHLYHFLIKFGQVDVKLFPQKKKKKRKHSFSLCCYFTNGICLDGKRIVLLSYLSFVASKIILNKFI